VLGEVWSQADNLLQEDRHVLSDENSKRVLIRLNPYSSCDSSGVGGIQASGPKEEESSNYE
jgi:hypothetical protein